MTITTKQFIKEVKEERIKKLLGIILDITFFDKFLLLNDEDKYRDELAKENAKLVQNDAKQVIKDDRDFKKLAELNAKIDKIKGIKNQRLQFIDMIDDLKIYVDLLDNLSEETKKELDNIINKEF